MLENKLSRVGVWVGVWGGGGWLDLLKIRLSHPAGAWLSLAINFPGRGWWRRLCGGGGAGYVVAGLTENKTKPSSWGLAELGKRSI